MHIPVLYIPSFYGDVRLELANDTDHTRVIVERSSQREREALYKMAQLAEKKAWLGDADEMSALVTGSDGAVVLKAPLLKVSAELTKLLKPQRSIVTAVKYADGRMVEVQGSGAEETPSSSSAAPGLVERAGAAVSKAADAVVDAVAGVSVAKPTQGCPQSVFQRAEQKARDVLEVFLDDEQMADFKAHGAFFSTGALTGHRYMITARTNPAGLKKTGGRSLYDLDTKEAFCVHDYVVPVAEECLALHLLLQLPEHENYLRHLEH